MSVARSCFICQENSQRLKYFHVPRNSAKLKAWTHILNGLNIKSSAIVCQKHFLKMHIKQNVELNCLRLSKDALPCLHLPNFDIKLEKEELVNADVFDEKLPVVANTKRKRASKKTRSTQTNLMATRMCAYVTVSKNLSSYKVNCNCCNKSFSLSDWQKFVAHVVESNYRNKTKINFESVTLTAAAADDETVLQAAKKRKIAHSNQINEPPDDFANEDEAVSNENASFCDIELKPTEAECEQLSMEFNLATAPESLVFDIIDWLRSAPVLWFQNTFKLGLYDKKLEDLSQEFFNKYNNQQLLLHTTQLYKAIDEICAWYRQNFKNQTAADKLPYPQKEYYQRCDKFLADSTDGKKTCQLCQILFNDHLQYFEHMRAAHPLEFCIDEFAFAFLNEKVDDYLTMRYNNNASSSVGNAKNSHLYCQLCRQRFKLVKKFFQHLKKHLHKRSFVCRLCGSAFMRAEALRVHATKHEKNFVFKKTCKICKKSFNGLTLYKSHQKNFHRPFDEGIGTVGGGEQIDKKLVDVEKDAAENELETLEEESPKDDVKTCLLCNKHFCNVRNLQKHYSKVHKIAWQAAAAAQTTAQSSGTNEGGDEIAEEPSHSHTDLEPVEAAVGIIDDELSDKDFSSEVMPQIENETKQLGIENSDSNSSDEEVIAEPKATKIHHMKMLPFGAQISSINLLNIQTCDPALVFFIIDLIKSTPTLWFENLFRTVKYEMTLQEVCERFSVKYPEFMTQIEFYDSIELIRNWYQKVFMEKSCNELTYPQSEYYRKCDEFLTDKSTGKTCTTCERVFNDHLQYFAHKKLESEQQQQKDDAKSSIETTRNSNNDDDAAEAEEEEEASAVSILKQNVECYLSTRYAIKYNLQHSYDCQVCGREAKIRNRFILHIKKHLKIRQFVCELCGSAFMQQESLAVHRRRHLGTMIKRECKICDKSFNDLTQLRDHRVRYHLPVEGTIEEIEAETKRKQSRGYRKRGVDEPVACNFCGRVFTQQTNMLKHKKVLHPKERAAEVAAKIANLKIKPKPKRKRARVLKYTNDE